MRHITPVSVLAAAVCAVWMASASPAAAQTATGTVSGRVTDSSGLPMPRVLVTVESPGLQGVRTTTTSANGDYLFPLLPPSSYVITFELGGFGIVKEQHTLAAAQPLIANVTLKPATVSEVVTVQAPVEGFTKTVQAATSVKQELLAALPTSRTLAAAVALAPAVHLTGPSNAIGISGAMSFENVFMLNGVQVQDNLRGQPLDLFIEDAIQETTITTSGVSAEYGRFTGGVVNAITKSGGNSVSGSFRTSFSNDDWRTVSPFGEPKASAVIPTYEFTVGGPILRNRTWFFGAGRFFESSQARETGLTRLPYTFQSNQKRIEGKVTQSFGAGHTVRLAYTDIRDAQTNRAYPSAPEILDLNSLDTRTVPQDLLSLHYAGALRPDFFLEGQFSRRNFTFKNSGGKSTDLIDGTVVYDNETDFRYHAPTFCGVCAPEERDNESVLVKGRYFWSTPRGAHNIAFGYDTFNDRRLSDNHQSASDYFLYVTGTIVRDGVPYPIIAADESAQIGWWPILEASRGTRFRTHGLFVNDAWQYNRHLTFNLGLRWDKNQGKDAVGQLVASDSGFAPRLGVVWDPRGDGRWNVTASYGRYLAALANNIADSSSPAGTPALFAYFYLGPEINVDPGAPLVTTAQAVRSVFDWFQANGGTSRPTFLARVPGTATQIRESLDSPHADELAVGLSRQIGGRGAVRADVGRDDRFAALRRLRSVHPVAGRGDALGQGAAVRTGRRRGRLHAAAHGDVLGRRPLLTRRAGVGQAWGQASVRCWSGVGSGADQTRWAMRASRASASLRTLSRSAAGSTGSTAWPRPSTTKQASSRHSKWTRRSRQPSASGSPGGPTMLAVRQRWK